MAVVFELSAHFGPDRDAADRFIAQIQQRYRSFPIGPHTIALHPPLLDARSSETNIEVSVDRRFKILRVDKWLKRLGNAVRRRGR
jgi:hypothetical protein